MSESKPKPLSYSFADRINLAYNDTSDNAMPPPAHGRWQKKPQWNGRNGRNKSRSSSRKRHPGDFQKPVGTNEVHKDRKSPPVQPSRFKESDPLVASEEVSGENGKEVCENVELAQELLPKHPLAHSWTLWYLKAETGLNWNELLNQVHTFNTIEDFWCLFHYVELASKTRSGSEYSLFKTGIEPAWEDPANKNGGRWIISLEQNSRDTYLDNLWLEVLLCLIGDNAGDLVCGAVVQVRSRGPRICIWCRDCHLEDAIMEVGLKIKSALRIHKNVSIKFEEHAAAAPRRGQKVYMYSV